MTLDLLDSNFSDLTHAEFILRLSTIGERLEVHPIFKEVPEYVPNWARFREMAQQYKTAVEAAAGGDRDRKAEKAAMRAEFQQNVDITKQHLVMVALHRKDLTILQNTGFDFKHKSPYVRISAAIVPPMPTKLWLKRGGSGTLFVTTNKPKGVASIEVQISTVDPPTEESWSDGISDVKARREVKNLEPLKKHFVRARFLSAAGVGPWSRVESEVVL